MKAFYSIIAAMGIYLILGTAGESDVFGLEIGQIALRLLWGVALILAGRIGYVSERHKLRRSRMIDTKTVHSEPASKAA